jgi:protein SCO1/2
MLTGDKAKIYQLGEKSYMVTAQEDKNEAGGFVHSGAFILVDKQRHVRGIYDGTKEDEVNHLIEDLEILLNEKP